MPSRRSAITMSEPELHRFLDEERVLTCATIGPSGRPHLMPLWYVRDGNTLLAWTYGKSQKIKNLERDASRHRPARGRGATSMVSCAASCSSATWRSSVTPSACRRVRACG